ncbi:MAG TPA: branched-chain amino acid transaminase [Candidatus Baltobacteraceae bacterium]|nr:branched-chain amino acid transaminase [Candidatus Baltobacteraceae bacterium]
MAHLAIENLNGPIWMDGRLVPWDQAQLHVLSHGLNYASSVFEGIRTYGGAPFKLSEHMERFQESARILAFPLPFTTAQLVEAARQVIGTQDLRDGYLRPVAWRGHEGLGISAPNTTTHVAIAGVPMGDLFTPELRKNGISLQVSSWRRPSPETAPIKAKAACHYAVGALAIKEALAAGCGDALMLDERGFIAESTGSNFFIVKGGILRTPIPDRALDGITRRTVLDLARQRGIETAEERLRLDDLAGATEAFLTGTAVEVIPVNRVDDAAIPGPRPITEALMEDYFKLVGKK